MIMPAHEAQKAKLQHKSRFRSTAAVEKKMPRGSGTLTSVPARGDAKYAAGSAGDKQWRDDFSGKADGFSTAHRAKSTHDEHEEYMGRFGHWLQKSGFGEFIKWERDANGKLELVPGIPTLPTTQVASVNAVADKR